MTMMSPDTMLGKGAEDEMAQARAKIEAWAAVLAGGTAGQVSNPRLRKAGTALAKIGDLALRYSGIAVSATNTVSTGASMTLPSLASAAGTVAGTIAPVVLPLAMVAAVYNGYRTYRLINRTFDLQYLYAVASLRWSLNAGWNCSQSTIDTLDYAVRQSAKKTARTGGGILPGVGVLVMMSTGMRSVWKRMGTRPNIHAKRNRSADGLLDAMKHSDAPAWALATELLGYQQIMALSAQSKVDEGAGLREAIYEGLQGR